MIYHSRESIWGKQYSDICWSHVMQMHVAMEYHIGILSIQYHLCFIKHLLCLSFLWKYGFWCRCKCITHYPNMLTAMHWANMAYALSHRSSLRMLFAVWHILVWGKRFKNTTYLTLVQYHIILMIIDNKCNNANCVVYVIALFADRLPYPVW